MFDLRPKWILNIKKKIDFITYFDQQLNQKLSKNCVIGLTKLSTDH